MSVAAHVGGFVVCYCHYSLLLNVLSVADDYHCSCDGGINADDDVEEDDVDD